MTNMRSRSDGLSSDEERDFLRRRAKGGFGVIETCAAFVAQDGKAWPGQLGVHTDAMLPGLVRLADAIHSEGMVASGQLFHGGVRANRAVSRMEKWSASAYIEDDKQLCREATQDDITTTIQAFVAAALRCQAAGFDMIEIHGAHGYLLAQFLSTVYNHRMDRWGGVLENRTRLLIKVVRAIKHAAPGLAISVRISPESYGKATGIDIDEMAAVARWLAQEGVDVIHLSLWRAQKNTKKYPAIHPTQLFRKALDGFSVAIVVAGDIWTLQDAEAQLAMGADAVAIGRAGIIDPDWPIKIRTEAKPFSAPRTVQELRDTGMSDKFIAYIKTFRGMVK